MSKKGCTRHGTRVNKMVKFICIQDVDHYKFGDIVEAKTHEEEIEFHRMSYYFHKIDESYLVYFDIKGPEPIQRLKEKLQNNMVPVTGFDYPFSISKCKLSQEDYAVIMGVDHFYNEEEPVGADCPYVTNSWDQFIERYGAGQNWGEIGDILEKLKEKTGRQLRLPTLKECKFVNNQKSEEFGFQLNNELCMAGWKYLCTETGGTYVSNPMGDLPPSYKSFRLVECDKPLSDIDFGGKEVIKSIDYQMDKYSEDMHYFWEN